MTIKKLITGDCKIVSELHLKAFPDFFLTALGKKFLDKFYRSILCHPNHIAVGLFENEKLLAFAVGTKKKRGFYSEILKDDILVLAWSGLPTFIKRPSKIIRIFKSLLARETKNDTVLENATLLSVCVDPDASQKGLGKNILKEFEFIAFKYANGISLTTDAENNEYVNKFYVNNNYHLLNTFTQGKRKMNLYFKSNDK